MMAQIALTVTGSAIGTLQSTLTLSEVDSERLLAFLTANYGKNEDGTDRTPQEIISAYWAAIASGTISNVLRWEQDQAAQVARDAISPISVS